MRLPPPQFPTLVLPLLVILGGATGLLCLVLVAARLSGLIDWAWIWVFSPAWGIWLFQLAAAAALLIRRRLHAESNPRPRPRAVHPNESSSGL